MIFSSGFSFLESRADDLPVPSKLSVVAPVSPAEISNICGRYSRLYTFFVIKGRPPRLDQIFQSYDPPLFFVTFGTLQRHTIINLAKAHDAFRKYAQRAVESNIAVGRYVMMPDHVHLFVRGGPEFELAKWVNGLKRAMSVALHATTKRSLWQPGFFDHLLRNHESYGRKWDYVRENPVRAGLVRSADEWLYQGEIIIIDRV